MTFQLQIKMNEKLFLRDPEQSDLGKKIIANSVILIHSIGFEAFTFKKLAIEIGTTEAGIYRYFENKHRVLVYLTAWYWGWLGFRVNYHTNNLNDSVAKIKRVIRLLVITEDDDFLSDYLDVKKLNEIIIIEGTKTYLTKHVSEDNKDRLFKPYKDLCADISQIILEINSKYKYPRSLSSSMIEMAHFQDFFMRNLPSLTDFKPGSDSLDLVRFLEEMVFGCIRVK